MATFDNNDNNLFNRLDADESLTAEKLQEELNKYAESIRSEYEINVKTAGDPSQVEEYTKDFFKKNVHSAAAQIVWLSNNATSESVQLNAAKYVVEQALSDAKRDGDPIRELINSLQAENAAS